MGSWVSDKDKKLHSEPMIEYWVICDHSDENLEFLTKLKQRLTDIFIQEEILMFYSVIYKL